MALIEFVRDLLKGTSATEPDVGEHDTADNSTKPAEPAAEQPADAFDDEIEQMRREWESEPSHH